jgi:hypothetical protein
VQLSKLTSVLNPQLWRGYFSGTPIAEEQCSHILSESGPPALLSYEVSLHTALQGVHIESLVLLHPAERYLPSVQFVHARQTLSESAEHGLASYSMPSMHGGEHSMHCDTSLGSIGTWLKEPSGHEETQVPLYKRLGLGYPKSCTQTRGSLVLMPRTINVSLFLLSAEGRLKSVNPL